MNTGLKENSFNAGWIGNMHDSKLQVFLHALILNPDSLNPSASQSQDVALLALLKLD